CPDQRPRPRFLGIPAGLFRHARLVALAGGPRGRPAFRGIGVYARRGAGVGGTRRAWRRDGVAALAGPLPPDLEAAAMIAQTFALADAPRRTWDVLVVGAGPAGSSAARGLARRGPSVLFGDQAAFPRWKGCGCCLN